MLLKTEHLYKYFNGEPLLKDISFTVEEHEAVGLIGVNGCGKSTLLGIILGEIGFDRTPEGLGSVEISPGCTVGFLRQNSGLESSATIDEELHKAFDKLLKTRRRMDELERQMTGLTGADLENVSGEYSELAAFFEANDGYRIDVRIDRITNGMGFADVPRDRIVSTLSGGEKTRLAMIKLLLEEPDLLILDEPSNHLDLNTLMWLEDYLKTYRGSVLAVSHDRYFLNKVCSRICEIEQGRLTSYKGGYSAYLVRKKMDTERQMKEYQAQQEEIHKLEDYIVRNKTRASTAKMAKSRQHMLDRIERVDRPLTFIKPPKIKLGYDIEPTREIVMVTDCDVTVGEGRTLVKKLDMLIRRGEHAAIIGPNGIGKTSVLKMIQGIIPHRTGSVVWGGNVKISYFEQEHNILNMHNTVIDELMDRFPRMTPEEARRVLGSVLISGEDVFKPISVLSGGERAKLCFAIMACTRGNVLVLDEPTNHLDFTTKEVLEDVLAEFGGTIILVSHDRYLLNKVAGRIIELGPQGARSFEGNFDSYSEAIKAEQDSLAIAQAEKKRAAELEEYTRQKEVKYRSKEQRALDAKRRERIRELEKLIEDTEVEIFRLENEISDPEVAANYEVMNEKCHRLEECRTSLDELMDEWAELSDQ
ncbi:MAG: ABC-F family ATP-binding cassette domain-containing protein [Ruminococcus sp.]|nr:ABC-F family ATP-binding cassette domain-containing protein [Ruminococcus sp.]